LILRCSAGKWWEATFLKNDALPIQQLNRSRRFDLQLLITGHRVSFAGHRTVI